MMAMRCGITALPLILAATPVVSAEMTMTPQGYTGLAITPTAHLLDWGKVDLAYDAQLPGAQSRTRLSGTDGHNYVVGFGLLPNLEFSGRIASNTTNSNCYVDGCGIRDLSANVKAGIGLDAARHYRVAVGATDVGGGATNFRSYYGVGTYTGGQWDVSVGLAQRSAVRNSGVKSPLGGIFGSVALSPFPWLQTSVEVVNTNAWAGAKLFAPQSWLPQGWRAHVAINARLTDSGVTQRSWIGVGVAIPLYKTPSLPTTAHAIPLPAYARDSGLRVEPTYPATALPPQDLQPRAPVGFEPAQPVSDGGLEGLAAALKAKGLEDISVGRMPDGSIVATVNNATYNWNALDALGVSLGVVARQLGDAKAGYRVVLSQRQIPLVGVTGQTDCLREWLAGETATCTAGQLYAAGGTALESLYQGATWVVRNEAPSWKTLRVSLQPVLASNVATEYGVFDYSAGIAVNLQQPLWRGATAEARYIAPLANSSDFERRGVYGSRRLHAGVDRVLLTQSLRLPLEKWLPGVSELQASRWGLSAVTAAASVGKINSIYDGVYGEMRWEPGEGKHRFGLEAGRFTRDRTVIGPLYGPILPTAPRVAEPLLGSYRYSHMQTRTNVEVTAGRFMNHDVGAQLVLRQWFADTAVALYAKRTKFETQRVSATFVGVEVTLPLGPRKDMSPGNFVQVTGVPRWSYAVETQTGATTNAISVAHAVRPGLATLNTTFNSDRSGLAYFEDNLRRVRDAAR